ncbi:MarR-like DNA-binding transcriptional regulator SgrR of sgrS sRNA [Alkalicoccobacillus murimartini]|uniref:MarR-like DNA-binding transcriptional regulator SgrR of sgrS sRNA n=2 Tax=Alkalicoccobacillus murimartini TaxID=171685 RepID=A0ABT9YC28_9BACI|nr:MarR-like DNA-binding transcriptional regulator SgrR of sgrS sRNA [Alkalicoccobacillus murimartini]
MTVEVTLEEIEQIWFCTRRNVKRVLKQLEAKQYFQYIPGKGRGNRSVLIFNHSFQEEIEGYIKECAEQDRLDRIAYVLRLPIPKAWIIQHSTDIQHLLGFKRNEDAKDILYTFKNREISTLDPLKASIALEVHLIQQLGDTLVQYDSINDEIKPHLAHHFLIDESETIYTFYLRKDVHFHNMDKVTSSDIVFTIKRLQSESRAYAWLTDSIQQIVCESPHKVSIYLKKKNSLFLRLLSTPSFCILPESSPNNEDEWIGTGPFILKERTKNKLILQAFGHYFKERPLIDEVHFYTVSQVAADTLYLQADQSEKLTETSDHTLRDLGFVYFLYNQQQNTLLQNQYLRTALYHLIDVPKMAAEVDLTILEASSFSEDRSIPSIRDQSYIPTLLKKANYQGEELSLAHLTNEWSKKEVKWMIKHALSYGVNLKSIPISHQDFYKQDISNKVDILFMKLVFSYDKHLAFMSAFKNEQLLMMRFLPKDAQSFMEEQLSQFEESYSYDKREQIIMNTETYLRQNHHINFLYHPVITRTLDPIIQDATHHSFGHLDFSKLWLP